MTNTNDRAPPVPGKLTEAVLLKVYDAALAEYRFNVSLAWDRTKFFLLLSSGLAAAGVALIKVAEDSAITWWFLVVFFVFSMLVTLLGLKTVAIGKKYYRESVYVKTLIEGELGLLSPLNASELHSTLSIAITDGQREVERILSRKDKERSGVGRLQTITDYSQGIFWVLCAVNVLGAIVSVIRACLPARAWHSGRGNS
jgi:hypothetical protein